MDSKDKALMDLRKNVADLKAIIPKKDAQIEQQRLIIKDYENKNAGNDAVRNHLQAEQALGNQLAEQLVTIQRQVKSLQDENASLKELNLKLQQDIQERQVHSPYEPM